MEPRNKKCKSQQQSISKYFCSQKGASTSDVSSHEDVDVVKHDISSPSLEVKPNETPQAGVYSKPNELPQTGVYSSVNELDIGRYVTQSSEMQVDFSTRVKVLQSTWKPPPGFVFPGNKEGEKTRHFRRDWLDKYAWLAYSNVPGCEGGFCKHCVLFARTCGGRGSQALGVLVVKPLSKYKKALAILEEHQKTQYHHFSVSQAEALISVHEKQITSVDVQLDEQKRKKLEENRRKLSSIVKTIILCGQQNIPLRGHRDSGRVSVGESESDRGSGNFHALLQFRVDAGDTYLAEHLEKSASNCLMTSAQIQNELITSCGNVIKNIIVSAIHKAGIYSLIADETTDVAKNEQLALGIRYVDVDKSEVREDFMGFMIVEKTTGKAIAESVRRKLESLSLDIKKLRGQGFDGGSNMSGIYRGAQAIINAEQPLAFYIHCASHRLNLSLGKACSVQAIRNVMGTIENVSSFLSHSSGRVLIMEKHVEDLYKEPGKKKRLKPLCQTRWVERHDSVIVFYDLLPAIVASLNEISKTSSDNKVTSLASCYQSAICKFEFVMALSVCVIVFGITKPLSVHLQKSALGITDAYDLIDECNKSLTSCRSEHFTSVFKFAKEMATTLGVEVEVPRIVGKMRHRVNVGSSSPFEHYKINMFYPFVDYLLSELTTRFHKNHPVFELQQIIPCAVDKINVESVIATASIYSEDLPNPTALPSELITWKARWKEVPIHDRPSTAIAAFKECSHLPNVKQLLQLMATIPVTSCCVERSFSALKRIKTEIRSVMKEDRLEGLSMLEIHKDVLVEVDQVIDDFARDKNRRLLLL